MVVIKSITRWRAIIWRAPGSIHYASESRSRACATRGVGDGSDRERKSCSEIIPVAGDEPDTRATAKGHDVVLLEGRPQKRDTTADCSHPGNSSSGGVHVRHGVERSHYRMLKNPTANALYSIADRLAAQQLRAEFGATPAASVNATISLSLKDDGENSPFVRVGRGSYGLRRKIEEAQSISVAPVETPEELGLINAFGMYWRRDNVLWKNSPQILGSNNQVRRQLILPIRLASLFP